jgi:hypothetical protein
MSGAVYWVPGAGYNQNQAPSTKQPETLSN